jgi:hypothetical protein
MALATSACVVGEEMPTDDDLPPPGSEAALTNNGRTAFNYFVSKGLSETQSAGIVGNLMQESSVRPTAVQPGGPGRGIAQWSIGGRWNTGRNNLTTFAAGRGADKWALQTQLDFMWQELAVVGGYGLTELRAATSLSTAVRVVQDKYEICGACAAGKRLQYAQEALAAYGRGTSTSGDGTPPPPPPPTTATCYSGTLEREMPQNACVESMYDGLWYQCSSGQWVDRWSDPDPCNGQYPL